jgi:2-methylisocitrate lyase-like PEP mutase family enzyme
MPATNPPSIQDKRRAFRAALSSCQPIFAPGVYDGFGLRLIEQFPVDAAYVSGNAVSACLLGEPDVGLVDLTLLADHLGRINQCTRLPIICDADTGYGSVVNIQRTVRSLEVAGVAAIHIEDQVTPKRCAQLPGARTVIDQDEAVARIAAACAARVQTDEPMVIVGRTDAAASLGLDAAIARAQAFVNAGAEAVFVELKTSPHLLEQICQVSQAVPAPCLINMSIDARLMALPKTQWAAAGIGVGIFPALARSSFGHALTSNLQHLLKGDVQALQSASLSPADYAQALGITAVEEWEQRFSAGSQG